MNAYNTVLSGVIFGLLIVTHSLWMRVVRLEDRITTIEAPAKCVAEFKANHPGWNVRDVDVGCGVTP